MKPAELDHHDPTRKGLRHNIGTGYFILGMVSRGPALATVVLYRHNQPGGHQSPQILPPPKLAGHRQNCRQPGGTSPVTVRTAVSLAARHQSPSELPSAWRHVTSHHQNCRQPGSTSQVTARITVSLVVHQNFRQPGGMSEFSSAW